MIDKCFYNNVGPFTLSDIASKLNLEFLGDPDFIIQDIATLDKASPDEISFFHTNKYRVQLNNTRAGAVILKKDEQKKINLKKNFLLSDNPYLTMASIASILYPDCEYPNFSFSNSKRNTSISENSFIHEDSKIGKNCVIGSEIVIKNSIIGENVVIQDGCKLGQKGFGFIPLKNENLKFPHIGKVLIMDNVEIASNCTIDRGSVDDTVIGKNTYLDNQVHLAHNVKIGENCMIAGQVGFAGSSTIGDNVSIGGQAGVSGHLKIGNNVKIGGGSGVVKDIEDNQIVMGYPAIPLKDFLKNSKK